MPHRPLPSFAALLLAAPALAQSPMRPLPLGRWHWEEPATREEAAPTPAVGSERGRPIEASAQLPLPGPEPEERRQGFARLHPFASVRGASELSDGSGQLELQRAGFEASLGWAGPERAFALHLASEASFYDWDLAAGPLGVSDPFNDLYSTHVGLETELGRDGRISWLIGAELAFGGEDEVDLDDSLQAGGLLGARLRASEDLSLAFGLAGLTRLEDDPWVVPYVGFDWRPSDSLRLATEGSELHLDWAFAQRWSLGFEAIYEYRSYRLNPDGPLAGAAFRDEEIRLGLNLRWEPIENVELELGVGRVVWSELGFRADDEEISEIEGENASWVGAGLRVSF